VSRSTIEVAVDCLWGAQTQRSLANFSISSERMPPELIGALAVLKSACSKVNLELGLLPANKAGAIITAAEEVVAGQHPDAFPLSVWQTGSGTQSNMNMNEVLANRASELLGGRRGSGSLIHPNDDVNLGQSSNDIFPSAMHLAACIGISRGLLPAVSALSAALAEKSDEFSGIIKIGRTHLQDATPLSLGQEFSGYVAQLAHARAVIAASLSSLYPLAVGGTAVGTGLNTHPQFGARVAAELAMRTGMPFTSAENKFAALAANDGLVAAHGALKTLAVALMSSPQLNR
jgi:fumarate hydratase class II